MDPEGVRSAELAGCGYSLLIHTVADINPAFTSRTLNYGNLWFFLIMGNAGFISSTVLSFFMHVERAS